MFSNESCKTADACRYCWMCRHICPVSNGTGREAWTPRARGLLVSMLERGVVEYDETIAEPMYMCSLCDACANDCVTGFKPSTYIREARTEAVVGNVAGEAVMKAVDTLQQTGNINGGKVDERIKDAAAKLPEKADVLLYIGEIGNTKAVDSSLAFMSLLRKAGVDFTILKEEPNSGVFLSELIGYTGEVQAQAKQTADAIKATGAKTLVALDPHDAGFFIDQYTQWNLLPDLEVTTATAYLASLIADGKLNPAKLEKKASFHDPCRLARSVGETEPAREILNAMGVEIEELFLNRKMSRCCGGPVLNSYAHDVIGKIVRVREEDALRIGSSCIITACPSCYYLMSTNSGGDVEYMDLFITLDNQCRGEEA
jgi:Fe-S oxidoreductase